MANMEYVAGQWPTPLDEAARLQTLKALDILDTAAESAFDNITKMGLALFKVPICLVSLVDHDRQWFKACYGLNTDQTGRDVAFCTRAIMPDAPPIYEVTDAIKDTRFASNPLVTGDPYIRYYAGAPLAVNILPEAGEQKLGTFCIIDTKPRPPMADEERAMLLNLAAMVSDQLTSRQHARELVKVNTELMHRTEEVNAVNQELKSLIDTANAPIFAVDTDLHITVWNRKISEITSLATLDVQGRFIGNVITSDAPPVSDGDAGGVQAPNDDFLSMLRAAVAGQSCACHDLSMSSKVHAHSIQLQVSAEPKRDKEGQIVGVVCVGEDIALRQRMLEATMKNHQLQRTNEAKDAFLACMSHEMRTPLNGLLGMLQLAMCVEEALPEQARRFVKQAQNSGTLLLNLINDILDITRIETGQLLLDIAPFSLRVALEEAVALLQHHSWFETPSTLSEDTAHPLAWWLPGLRSLLRLRASE